MIHDPDVFGRLLLAHADGGDSHFFIERSDGMLNAAMADEYFSPPRDPGERRALAMVRGRVLDIGCGAGRHALPLQRRGLAVTGIDASPLAIRVCRTRAMRDARVLALEHAGRLPAGFFDSVIMFGNNFGLFGTPQRARRRLRMLHRITTPGARLFGGSLDVRRTRNPEHLAYHRWNRLRRRWPGQVRLRVRFGSRVGPWLEWLMVGPDEMRSVLRGTGWRLIRTLPGAGPSYVGVIGKC